MATLTAERERYDAEPACRVAGFTLGEVRAGRGRGEGGRRGDGGAGPAARRSSTQHAGDDVVDGATGQGVDVTTSGMTQRSA
jgi:hypothetical protein